MPVLKDVRTADQVLTMVREKNPTRRFARNVKGDLLGLWSDDLGRYVVIASLSITGEWVSLPYEIKANGEPMVKPGEWIEGRA
ncbi:MAG: hypothetical protein HY348_06450 [Nitrospira defluvii]|nr:hypothetical protein [Nitrospira defluvii]